MNKLAKAFRQGFKKEAEGEGNSPGAVSGALMGGAGGAAAGYGAGKGAYALGEMYQSRQLTSLGDKLDTLATGDLDDKAAKELAESYEKLVSNIDADQMSLMREVEGPGKNNSAQLLDISSKAKKGDEAAQSLIKNVRSSFGKAIPVLGPQTRKALRAGGPIAGGIAGAAGLGSHFAD